MVYWFKCNQIFIEFNFFSKSVAGSDFVMSNPIILKNDFIMILK